MRAEERSYSKDKARYAYIIKDEDGKLYVSIGNVRKEYAWNTPREGIATYGYPVIEKPGMNTKMFVFAENELYVNFTDSHPIKGGHVVYTCKDGYNILTRSKYGLYVQFVGRYFAHEWI